MVFKKNKNVFLFGFLTLIFFVFPFSFSGDFFVVHADGSSLMQYAINPLLTGIQKLLGMFLGLGIWLITLAIDADFLNKMLNGPAVETSWKAVRDICNLGFILTLLFSAFATIFQVQKYHIKNLILNIVLVALLINFSYPIVRFVADLGNVPMYYLAETLFGKTKTGSVLAEESNIVCALIPGYGGTEKCPQTGKSVSTGESDQTANLLASIVMLFILGITMFVIALLFVIRVIALCILIIFSPIGFIGLAVPPLKKYADEYWGNLVKYTIFGPVMLLIIAISTKLMHTFNESGSNMDSFVGALAKFSVPIVILWMGINMGMKMGVAGSDITMKYAKSWGKGLGKFGLRWGTPYGYLGAYAKQAGYAGAIKNKLAYHKKKGISILGNRIGGSEAREYNETIKTAKWLGGKGARDAAIRDYKRKQSFELQEEYKKNNVSESTLLQKTMNGNQAEKTAAARLLAERGLLSNSDALAKTLNQISFSPEDVQHVLQKADKRALGSLSGENYVDILSSMQSDKNKKDAEEYTGNESAQIAASLEKIKAVLDGRLREEGNILARIQGASVNIQRGNVVNEGDGAKEILSGMNADDLAKQKTAFFKNSDVKGHMTSLERGDDKEKRVFDQFINKASQEKIKELGVSAQQQGQQKKESAYQESLRKRADRADIQNRAQSKR